MLKEIQNDDDWNTRVIRNSQQVEFNRRRFLVLLSVSGAATFLTACTTGKSIFTTSLLPAVTSTSIAAGNRVSSLPLQPAESNHGFTIIRDIEYGKSGGISLRLDAYVPTTPLLTPMPAVIWIHGGGWSSGDKYPINKQFLVQSGFFLVSINYRLSGLAPFPAAVQDCKCAVRWLRVNATNYGVDPERLAVWGSSAGGHLALMTAVAHESGELEGNGGWSGVSSQVQSVCSYFGVSDFVSWAQEVPAVFSTGTSGITAFLGGTPAQKPDIYRAASPVHYISVNDPPLLLFHGDHDRSVPFAQSQIMYDAYRKAGLDATLIKVLGADHNFVQATANVPISPSQEQIELSTREFFVNTLVNR